MKPFESARLCGSFRVRRLYQSVAVCSGLYLTACATPPAEPVVVVQRVEVPVSVPCVDPSDIPPVRVYADQAIQPPATLYLMTQAMGLGIAERDEVEPTLRALLAGCVAN